MIQQLHTPNDFINAIIHDLKTPLNEIVCLSEILQKEIHDPVYRNECIDYAKEIKCAIFELNDLVHDLLDFGMAGNQGFRVNLNKEIHIKDVIERSVKLNNSYSERMKIQLNTAIPDDLPPIKLDNKRVKQILTNLISNAIKYSPKGSKVLISAKVAFDNKDKMHLEISVLDQGFGMTPAQVKKAFQKYQTIKNPNSKKVDSLGIGLPIVKILTELQKGAIEVKSQPGRGSEFVVRFPYKIEQENNSKQRASRLVAYGA